MPRMGSFGGASWSAFCAKGVRQATFRSAADTIGAGTLTKPAGVAVGDLVVIFQTNNAAISTTAGTAWNVETLSASLQITWKILDATDVANNWVGNAGNTYVAAYIMPPGATGLADFSYASGAFASGAFTLSGVPRLNTRGVITWLYITPGHALTNPAAPFVQRLAVAPNDRGMSDDLSGGYNGGSVSWSGTSGQATAYAVLFRII